MNISDWSLSVITPGEKNIFSMPLHLSQSETLTAADNLTIKLIHSELDGIHIFEACVQSAEALECYFSLNRKNALSELASFVGVEDTHDIYRQSPHDPLRWHFDMRKQPVPMAACKTDDGYEVALSDAPYLSDNYTTQEFVPAEHRFSITSGDSGRKPGHQGDIDFAPYYHRVDAEHPHVFRFLIFTSHAKSLYRLRMDTFLAITKCFGKGDSLYHAICFATNYMHLRRNETGSSRFWVVAGIEYANTQYIRDSFWQCMILPKDISSECYLALRNKCRSAETPLIQLLWAYGIFKSGGDPLYDQVDQALRRVREQTHDGFFHPEKDSIGRCDFRSWFDLCAHTDTDAITYNQGLYAAAMHGAYEMGCASKEEYELAAECYRSMFIKELGIYPVSREKVALCVDPLVGDLLHRLMFGEHLLPSEDVLSHYRTVCEKCTTPYGIKISAELDGSYHPKEFFGIPGYLNDYYDTNPAAAPGHYIWGSSYFIYEMLFHIDALLQGAKEAEQNIINRTLLDFSLGNTYFEHVNTATGKPGKANQGWNAAIYAIYQQLVQEGAVSSRYFDEMEKYLSAVE